MSDPFTKHGIKWLSTSSLNTYHNEPAWFVARYLFGVRDEMGPKGARGNAVEAGVNVFLSGGDFRAATKEALHNFALNTEGLADEDHEEQRAIIPKMVIEAIEALSTWDRTSRPAYQLKIEHRFDGIEIPVIGYVDWLWPTLGLDLKTTERMPSRAKEDHLRQMALYQAATGRPFRLLYVTPAKRKIVPDAFDDLAAWDQIMTDKLAELRRIALGLRKVLANSSCKEEAAEFFTPKLDEFYWNDKTREEAARIWK